MILRATETTVKKNEQITRLRKKTKKVEDAGLMTQKNTPNPGKISSISSGESHCLELEW